MTTASVSKEHLAPRSRTSAPSVPAPRTSRRLAYPVLLTGLCASVAGYALAAVLAVRLLAQVLA